MYTRAQLSKREGPVAVRVGAREKEREREPARRGPGKERTEALGAGSRLLTATGCTRCARGAPREPEKSKEREGEREIYRERSAINAGRETGEAREPWRSCKKDRVEQEEERENERDIATRPPFANISPNLDSHTYEAHAHAEPTHPVRARQLAPAAGESAAAYATTITLCARASKRVSERRRRDRSSSSTVSTAVPAVTTTTKTTKTTIGARERRTAE